MENVLVLAECVITVRCQKVTVFVKITVTNTEKLIVTCVMVLEKMKMYKYILKYTTERYGDGIYEVNHIIPFCSDISKEELNNKIFKHYQNGYARKVSLQLTDSILIPHDAFMWHTPSLAALYEPKVFLLEEWFNEYVQ